MAGKVKDNRCARELELRRKIREAKKKGAYQGDEWVEDSKGYPRKRIRR